MRNTLKTNFVGICFAILALVFVFAAEAKAFDPRNDYMCAALFKTAFEQEATKDPTGDPVDGMILRFYSDRIKLLRWKLLPMANTYELTRFNNFVGQYMKDMDTATALLHLQRCESRIHVIYAEYKDTL